MAMTDKLTPNTMKTQYDHQYNVFCRKNHDYGNSFEKSLDTFGLAAGIVRMNDKFERLVSLNDPNKDAQIASESLVDTLEDLSNYAAMAACWLKRKKEALDDKGIKYQPQFSGIHLNGPEKLELNLEVDQDKPFEILNALHPSNLPKSVKVDYGHKAVYEFPDGIDTIASYLKQLSKEEAKKENDRVMLDMMLSRIEKGEVVRIVANGDGSFTTYFEKQTLNDLLRSKGFDPVEDKDDE